MNILPESLLILLEVYLAILGCYVLTKLIDLLVFRKTIRQSEKSQIPDASKTDHSQVNTI